MVPWLLTGDITLIAGVVVGVVDHGDVPQSQADHTPQ